MIKYVLVQAAFQLPEDFDLKKADLNEALEAMIIYRMTRDRLRKSPKWKRKAKQWNSIHDLFVEFCKDTSTSDRKLCATFGFGEIDNRPKIAPKKARAR